MNPLLRFDSYQTSPALQNWTEATNCEKMIRLPIDYSVRREPWGNGGKLKLLTAPFNDRDYALGLTLDRNLSK